MCDPVTLYIIGGTLVVDEVANDGRIRKELGNAVEWVIDEVVDPVLTTVGKVIEAALDNPVKTIAQIAAYATGNVWALPLIEGADVAAKGGDLGDVLEATAKAFIMQEVGSYVGQVAGSAAGEYAGSLEYADEATKVATQKLATEIIGSAAGSAAVAVVAGQDPVKAFVTGGVGAAVPTVLGKVTGFKQLPNAAQRVISSAVATQLSGGNVTAAVINSAIAASGVVTNALKSFDPDGTKLTDAQRAILTDVLMGTATAAITGGNPSNVINAALMKAGSKALGEMATEGFKKLTTDASKSYDAAETVADKVDANEASQKTVADKYNKVAGELKTRLDKQTELKTAYDNAVAAHNKNPTQATADTANAAVKAYNDYVKQLNTDYEKTYKPQLDKYGGELDKLKQTHAVLAKDYEKAIQAFATKTDTMADSLDSVREISDKAFVEAMDSKFDAEQYKKLNGLSEDQDPYQHFLATGQFTKAPTNDKAAEPVIAQERTRLVTEALAAKGVTLATADPAMVAKIMDNLDAKYGDNIGAMKAASIQDVINSNTATINQLVTDQKNGTFNVERNGTNYGAWNKPTDFTPPAGTKLASFEAFDGGKASLVYDNKGRPVWVENDPSTAVKTWNPTTGDYTLPDVVITAKRPTEQERILAIAELGEEDVVQGTVSRAVLNAAQTLVGWAQKSGNSTLINTTANIMKAGGGFVESINGMSVLLGVAPSSTKMGKFATALENIGKAGNTAEYQAAAANMKSIIGNAKGVGGTLQAIYGAFESAPLQFLAEYVGVEGFQEVAPLLIGGVASTGAKGAALALNYGKAVAAKMGTAAGMTAAISTDIAESAGGAATSAYNETYKVAIKAGKTPAEADKIAMEVAQRQAFVAGATTAVSMGIGGAALEKAVLGRTGTGLGDAMQALGDFAKTGTKIAIKEGVSEGGEEGITQAALEGQLYKLDPTRDVAKEITQAVAFGTIAGGPIAGGAYGASRAGDVISNAIQGNSVVADILETNKGNPAAADAALAKFGITDNVVKSNLMNTIDNANYTSSAEAANSLAARSDYTFSDADVAALTGKGTDGTLASRVEAYVDPRVLSVEEVKAAALAEGYTLTDEEAAKLAGQKDEAAGVTAVKTQYDPLGTTKAEAEAFFKEQGYTPTAADLAAYTGNKKESDTKSAIATKYDPLATTEQEVKDFFAKEGYTPTAAEIAAYVGNKTESDIGAQIATKYDPLAVTEQEAKDFFAAQNYTPTAAELAAYVGNKKEADTKTAIDTKYDPLAVTKEEATAAAKGENYTLSDKEIAEYIGNKSEKDTLAAIVKYVDPQAVTEAEAKAFFAEQGYPPSAEELATYIGQKSEAQIAKDVAAYADPKAVTAAEAKAFFDKQGYPATDAQIKQFTKVADETQVGKDVAAYVDPRQVTATEAEAFLTGLGYKPTKEEINKFVTSSADAIQTAIQGDVAKYVDPLLVDKDEVKQSFIDAGFKDVTDADVARFIGQYAEKDLSGKVKDYLPIATYNATTEQIAGVKTDVLNKLSEYEKAGIKRDEALEKSINDVAADLGTTREEILGMIGAPAVADDPATKDVNEAKPATGIYSELGDIKTDIQTKYDALTDGQKDLADQLVKQGVDLNKAIDTAKGELQTDIEGVRTALGQDTQKVSQTDLDTVIKMLETQGAYDPQYDYNGDKVIDQKDKTALEMYLKSTEPGYKPDTEDPFTYNPAAGSKWAPTGVYATLAENKAATEKAIADEAEKTRQAQAAAALKTQRMGNLNSLMGMLGQAQDTGGQQVTVKAADPAKIGYIYDWNSIFANPSQEKMFVSPFAQGGMVDGSDDVNNELLKILKG